MAELADLGFDPEVTGGDDGVTIAFTHCPFRELAEANPELVCGLHRGMVEGFVDALGRRPKRRRPSAPWSTVCPCQVDVVEVPTSVALVRCKHRGGPP